MSNFHNFKPILILLFSSLLFNAPLLADPPADKGRPAKEKGAEKPGKGSADFSMDLSLLVSAGISVGDARRLAVDEGLTGMKPLPPGIRKNLARGKPMPPGIAKTRMTGSFVNRLPRHEGYEWLRAGSDLVLVVTGSLVISDILEGVFR